jgi:nitrate/nitrite-specific signal transduction histidine kinase
VWVPVGPAASHGTLALTFSQDGDLAVIERMRLESLLSSVVVGLMTVAVVYAFLMRRLQPLQRLAAFSRNLAGEAGAQLSSAHGSKELDDLAASLNHA